MRLGILASGQGTGAKNLILFAQKHGDSFKACCVVSNKPKAPVLERAQALGVSTHLVAGGDEGEMAHILREAEVDVVCLAGFMNILSGDFLSKFKAVVNIHPSRLPEFPGLRAYERAFESKQPYSGITIHLVDEGVDTGPILLQETFPRRPGDTLEIFKQRGRELEKSIYPRALMLLRERL